MAESDTIRFSAFSRRTYWTCHWHIYQNVQSSNIRPAVHVTVDSSGGISVCRVQGCELSETYISRLYALSAVWAHAASWAGTGAPGRTVKSCRAEVQKGIGFHKLPASHWRQIKVGEGKEAFITNQAYRQISSQRTQMQEAAETL